MKKYAVALYICFICFSAKAQMADVLGAMEIQGILTNEANRQIANGNKAMNQLQFQQDLSSLIMEIQMNFYGNYNALNKNMLSFNGFRGLEWNIYPYQNGFVIEFTKLDSANCLFCKNTSLGAQKVEIDGDCNSGGSVKLYF